MILGLELTDSTVRAVIVSDGGEIVARAEQGSSGGVGPAIRESVRRAQAAAQTDLSGVGVATTSPSDVLSRESASALADAVPGIEILVVSSGTAAAIAETWCGAARGLQNVVTLAIGEHVTAGLIVNGQPWTGAHGYAGSVGWLALNPVEREDYRRLGALEAEVAAAGIVRRLVWRVKSGDHSEIVDQVHGDLSKLTAEMVFAGARTGDGVCISVVRDTSKYVGMAVANLATVLDPEAMVLGGTLATLGDMMLEPIRGECARRLSPPQHESVRIVLSTLGADAVAIGAARAATRQGR